MRYTLKINRFKQLVLSAIILLSIACTNNIQESSLIFSRNDFPDVLDVVNTPMEPVENDANGLINELVHLKTHIFM